MCKKTFLVSRFCFCQQIQSADFCCQQNIFLSADSLSKFLSTADFFFVSKCLCRRHGNDAHTGIFSFAPAWFLTETFSPSAGAHFRFYHDSIRFAGPSWRRYFRDLTTTRFVREAGFWNIDVLFWGFRETFLCKDNSSIWTSIGVASLWQRKALSLCT